MPRFKVSLFAPGASTPSVLKDVSAGDVREAAEVAAGARLATRGAQLRARAWSVDNPVVKTDFYAPASTDSPPTRKRRTSR